MIVICVLGVINFVAVIDVMVRCKLVTGGLELCQTLLVGVRLVTALVVDTLRFRRMSFSLEGKQVIP